MPDFSGLEAFSVVHDAGLDLPFVIVSGTIGEDIAVDALKAGVHDFMSKGKLARLVPTIEREMREVAVRQPSQFDEYVWFDETDAVSPLDVAELPREVAHPLAP